jgi:hypothetical protein
MMSADNWRVCPQCLLEHRKSMETCLIGHKNQITQALAAIKENQVLASIKANISHIDLPSSPKETLREDYEVGISQDGQFFVNYSGYCKACEFSFSFKQSVNTLEKPV